MKVIKTVATFIGLKIAEIGGVVVLPLVVGKLARRWIPQLHIPSSATWITGLLLVILLALGLLVVWLLVALNWGWAKKLTK